MGRTEAGHPQDELLDHGPRLGHKPPRQHMDLTGVALRVDPVKAYRGTQPLVELLRNLGGAHRHTSVLASAPRGFRSGRQ